MTIKINPAHKGLLTEKVGKKGLTTEALTKGIAKAKKTGNVKLEKEEVFAKNAKKFNHPAGKGKTITTDRGAFKMK